MDICCGYFRGKFYMRKYGDPTAVFREVGNVSAFTINHDVTELTQENFTSLGGNACALSYINGANLAMTLNCLKKENLALAFQGTVTNFAVEASETEEIEVEELGVLLPLAYIPKKASVVVTDGATPTPETFVEGEDYIVTSAGIIPLVGGAITTSDTLEITYTYGVGSVVEGMTTSAQTVEIIFDGINAGEDGEQEVVLRAWKVKIGPAATFDLLTTGEFASLEITGQILEDSTKIGAGVSKYYNFESREVA